VCYIYALIDPLTHLVRYVGQAVNLKQRYWTHCSGKDACTGPWVKTLDQPPILVILETVNRTRVRQKLPPKSGHIGRISLGTIAETKWIKRFRRTIINRKTRQNSATTWDWLVNPDEQAS
jgi:GIY-YIG catalytic domain